MLTKLGRLIWILWVATLAACADLPSEQPQSATPIATPPTEATEQPEFATPIATSPTEAVKPTEISAAPLEVEFDPDGLFIGPGSGFVALNDPAVVPGTQASWLSPDELVLGVVVGEQARAYPISQMAYHHIANDQIDGEPYLVTY